MLPFLSPLKLQSPRDRISLIQLIQSFRVVWIVPHICLWTFTSMLGTFQVELTLGHLVALHIQSVLHRKRLGPCCCSQCFWSSYDSFNLLLGQLNIQDSLFFLLYHIFLSVSFDIIKNLLKSLLDRNLRLRFKGSRLWLGSLTNLVTLMINCLTSIQGMGYLSLRCLFPWVLPLDVLTRKT